MRVAALDLGTNTFLLLVADVEMVNGQRQIVKVVHDEVRVIRLGQGVHEARRFHPEALKRADDCFADYAATIKKLSAEKPVEKILACATSAARDVSNGQELIDLGAKHGIPIEIISGVREAELTFKGVMPGPQPGSAGSKFDAPALIVDTGGGSTEYILGDRNGIKIRKSLDIGSVRLTEMFVSKHPISSEELGKIRDFINTKIREGLGEFKVSGSTKVIAVAGTPTTLATLDMKLPFESERVDGYHLSAEKISSWVTTLAAMTVEQRQALAGMEPKRADVLVAGAMILNLTAEYFHSTDLEVSIRGLRYGLAKDLGK
jgi:exopolyphosphatase / guanosine-5'-triphosphate,3'-diphosphate pyrophosphatase